jgi:hypothetical protein
MSIPLVEGRRNAEPEHLETRVWGVSGRVRNFEQNSTLNLDPLPFGQLLRAWREKFAEVCWSTLTR